MLDNIGPCSVKLMPQALAHILKILLLDLVLPEEGNILDQWLKSLQVLCIPSLKGLLEYSYDLLNHDYQQLNLTSSSLSFYLA
jgi:hypothetical protein